MAVEESDPQLLKVSEVARILRVNDRFVSRMIERGQLPAVCLSGRIRRIRPEDLDELLAPKRAKSGTPLPDPAKSDVTARHDEL